MSFPHDFILDSQPRFRLTPLECFNLYNFLINLRFFMKLVAKCSASVSLSDQVHVKVCKLNPIPLTTQFLGNLPEAVYHYLVPIFSQATYNLLFLNQRKGGKQFSTKYIMCQTRGSTWDPHAFEEDMLPTKLLRPNPLPLEGSEPHTFRESSSTQYRINHRGHIV